MKYIAKPKLANNIGLKEFADAVEAITYLNQYLLPKDGDLDRFDYVFIAPSVSPKKLKKSIEEYVGIGKLIVVE
jgi:hypothetical protein